MDVKKRHVMLERYGADNPQRVQAFRSKARQTNIKRYGHEVSSQSETVKEKASQTNLTRFGVDWHTQSQNFVDKARETWLSRYGVDHPMKADEVKAKYDFVDIWRQAHETKKLNGTYATSKAEDRFHEQLVRVFGEAERQVPVQYEHGVCLIDFKTRDVYVQFDGVYWHGLDRPIEVIRESRTQRDAMIVRRYEADRFQDQWFVIHGLKLIRITDRQAKTLTDDELIGLLTFRKGS